MSLLRSCSDERARGQALVEFSLILIPFLFLLMGVVDLGRGIAAYNGVAEAAREIARTTSLHRGSPLGSSTQTAATIATQRKVVLGLSDPAATITFSCTDGSAAPATLPCGFGEYVRVEVTVPFTVLTPVLSMVAPTTLSSVSYVKIP
jgi:Flp pilus assembly protein TadG